MAIVDYSYGRLIESFSVIVVDDDPVQVMMRLKDEPLPITVIFKTTLNPETNAVGMNWRTEKGVCHITFYGWVDAIGTTTPQVKTRFGSTSAGETIYFLAMHQKIGTTNHLTMQFVLGHLNESKQ